MLLQAAAPLLALTACFGDRPVTRFAPVLLDSLEAEILRVHEAVHRRQLAGACRARLAASRQSWAIRLAWEAEAYCVSETLRRETRGERRLRVLTLLVTAVPEAGPPELAASVRYWCR